MHERFPFGWKPSLRILLSTSTNIAFLLKSSQKRLTESSAHLHVTHLLIMHDLENRLSHLPQGNLPSSAEGRQTLIKYLSNEIKNNLITNATAELAQTFDLIKKSFFFFKMDLYPLLLIRDVVQSLPISLRY